MFIYILRKQCVYALDIYCIYKHLNHQYVSLDTEKTILKVGWFVGWIVGWMDWIRLDWIGWDG